MDLGLLWRAALVQLAAVTGLFAILLALPLDDDFFREWGAVAGPVSWAVCSAVTGRLLSLGVQTTVVAAVTGGALAAMGGVLGSHSAGLVAGVLGFAVVVAARGRDGSRVAPIVVR